MNEVTDPAAYVGRSAEQVDEFVTTFSYCSGAAAVPGGDDQGIKTERLTVLCASRSARGARCVIHQPCASSATIRSAPSQCSVLAGQPQCVSSLRNIGAFSRTCSTSGSRAAPAGRRRRGCRASRAVPAPGSKVRSAEVDPGQPLVERKRLDVREAAVLVALQPHALAARHLGQSARAGRPASCGSRRSTATWSPSTGDAARAPRPALSTFSTCLPLRVLARHLVLRRRRSRGRRGRRDQQLAPAGVDERRRRCRSPAPCRPSSRIGSPWPRPPGSLSAPSV